MRKENKSVIKPNDSNPTTEDGGTHSIGRVLKKYRKAAHLTQAQLADQMKTHKNTIFAWENDIQMPSLEKAMELCLILHMPIQELCGVYEGGDSAALSDPLERRLRNSYEALSGNYRLMLVNIAESMNRQQEDEKTRMLEEDVSFFEHSVTKAAAGTGCAYGDIPVDYRFIRFNSRYKNADAVITVDGHSMEPKYQDGDMVYVKYTSDVPDGCDVICQSNDGQLIKRKQGGVCISLNPDPQYVLHKSEDDHVTVIGQVLGIVNPTDIMDKSLYPELEEVHYREVRNFNRKHHNELYDNGDYLP